MWKNDFVDPIFSLQFAIWVLYKMADYSKMKKSYKNPLQNPEDI